MEIKNVYTSYNMGDLICSLAGLKKVCDETNSQLVIYQRLNLQMASYFPMQNHPTTDENGQAVGINLAMYNLLKPLLESQYYIKEYRIFDGENYFDYNLETARMDRLLPLPAGQLQTYDSFTYPELSCDLSKPWIILPRFPSERVLIGRTERYTNPYITYNFLNQYFGNIFFIGTEREHELFNKQWGLDIKHLKVNNFLQLAQEISHCKFYLGNASFCWHLADAMKVPRILEFCREFPNSSPTGANGYQFLHQSSLEYFFNQLNK
jgi:hypothetical protein